MEDVSEILILIACFTSLASMLGSGWAACRAIDYWRWRYRGLMWASVAILLVTLSLYMLRVVGYLESQ